MSTNAIESQGMLFKVRISNVYHNIVDVKSFDGPNGSAAIIDCTDLSDTAKTKRMGLQDWGQLQLTLNYRPTATTHAYLLSLKDSRELNYFRIQFTDTGATLWTFRGYVTQFAISGAVDGVVEAQVTIEISGDITES